MDYNYEYFSGANVTVNAGGNNVVECAGISYSVSTSRQPVYGYNSEFFDVMLPGRAIVQGTLIVNFKHKHYLERVIYRSEDDALLNKYNGEAFTININFGNSGDAKKSETIVDCYLVSSGKTVQINEQVILEEYSFVAKAIL